MIPLPTPPRAASRVVRTLHQVLATVLVLFPTLVVLLDLTADKAATISGLLVVGVTVVAKAYNLIFPADPPLDPPVG